MALFTLFAAAEMRDIWAVNFIDTAKPALSSAGEVIFEPDDRRCKDVFEVGLGLHQQRGCILRRQVCIDDHNYSFRESPREGHFICATSMSRVLHSGAKHR